MASWVPLHCRDRGAVVPRRWITSRSCKRHDGERKRVSASKVELQLAMSPTCLQPQERGDQCIDFFARVVESQ